MIAAYIMVIIAAYLIGSIPSGLLIGTYFYNKDLRLYGSRNIGATNAYRVLGKVGGLSVFLCDAVKGAIGTYLGYIMVEYIIIEYMPTLWLAHPNETVSMMIAGGISAILGHNFSVFLKFSGGRGVATGLGVMLCLVPTISLMVLAVWIVIVGLTKYVSLGSVISAALVPILMYLLDEPMELVIFGLVAAFFVIYKHKDNIKRLLAGTELKVERIKK